MAFSYHIVISISLSVLLLFVTHSLAFDVETEFCSSRIDSESPIKSNINQFLNNLTPKFQQGARFVESSYGKGKNKIYGLAQCRGRADPRTCLGCIHDLAQTQTQDAEATCPNQPEVSLWYDFCYVRYGQEKFYGKVDTTNVMLIGNTENVTDPDSLAKSVGKLFNNLNSNAAKPGNGGFAKGTLDISKFDTLYGMAECTADLSSASCAQCLATTIDNFIGFCSGRKGCRVYFVNCNVRYELYPFFYPSDTQIPKGEKLEKMIIHKA